MTSLNLNLFRACLIMAIIPLVGVSPVSAQELPRPITPPRGTAAGSISGRVVLPSGHPLNSSVRITLSTPEDPGPLVYTDNSGNFSFTNLGEGTYTVEVLADRKLYEPVSETVRLIRSSRVHLMIYLREKAKPSNSAGNLVSSSEIDQNVPATAKKEYEKAIRLLGEGKSQEAIERLKQALTIYPPYLAVRNDLGVQYLKLNRLADATEQFETAIEINNKAFNPRLNLGIVLIKRKKYTEALDHLTLANSIDSASPAAHLYLGIASLEMDELGAAERELTRALSIGGQEYSVAHFYLGLFFMKNGDPNKAIRELKIYLETSPNGEETTRARQLLERMPQS